MQKNNQLQTAPKLKVFAILLIAIEVAMIILFGLFVRVTRITNWNFNSFYYPMYQDVNVMMLVGFGFLMAYIRGYDWSALSYTFFINSVTVQLYILLSAFWLRVFHDHEEGEKSIWTFRYVFLSENVFIAASYSVAAILIAFGAPLGKTGPLQLLILAVTGTIGYTLNQNLIYQVLEIIDVGGSTGIHTYGAFLGLTFAIVIGKKNYPEIPFRETRQNSTFAMIGTLFLWMFWPSFNAAYFTQTDFQRTFIVSNTIVSLTGSCLSAFATAIFKRGKFNINDILNGTLAGGVAIGASASVVANSGIALLIGFLAGILATLSEILMTKPLRKMKIHDTIGILYLHGLPGLMGGFVSAMVIASYQTSPGLDEQYQGHIIVLNKDRTFSQQASIQVACTFISAGIGIVFGIIAGLIAYPFYSLKSSQHYNDGQYFHPHPDQVNEFSTRKKQEFPTNVSLAQNLGKKDDL